MSLDVVVPARLPLPYLLTEFFAPSLSFLIKGKATNESSQILTNRVK